jgi:hypothetical protein
LILEEAPATAVVVAVPAVAVAAAAAAAVLAVVVQEAAAPEAAVVVQEPLAVVLQADLQAEIKDHTIQMQNILVHPLKRISQLVVMAIQSRVMFHPEGHLQAKLLRMFMPA